MLGTSKSIWGFDPRSVSGCALWLDGADTASTTMSGNNITVWRDKSGNGRNATAVGNVGTSTINGIRAVAFAGGSLTGYFTGNFPYTGPSLSIFSVSMPISQVGYRIFSFGLAGAADYSAAGYGNFGAGSVFFGFKNNGDNVVSPAIAFGTPYVTSLIWDGTNANININGGFITSATQRGGGFTISNYALGIDVVGTALDPAVWSGNVGELIVYTGALTSTQRQSIEGYLANKWGFASKGGVISPLDYAGCALWLDAADASTMTFSSGSNISQWRDKSGNGRNGTGSNSPVLTPNQQAGLSVVTLASASSQFFDFGDTLNLGTGGLTVFFVGRTTLGVNQGFITKSSARAFAGRWFLLSQSFQNLLYFTVDPAGAGAVEAFTTSTATSGLFTIYSGTIDRVTSNILYTNGTVVGSIPFSNSTNLTTTDKLYVGAYGNSTGSSPLGGFYYNGTIGEIIVYNTGLTTSQRIGVENYLFRKWGLRPSLPSIHPFRSLAPFNRVFSPLDIPGCQMWLDGADLSSMTLSGINVTQWSDKSGSGNHATGGVSPTYSSSAGAVLFNGTSSYLQTSLSAVPTVETVFVVFRASILPTQTDAGAVIFGATGSGGRGFVVITNATSGSTAYQLRYDAYAVGNIALTPYGGVIYNTLTLATAQYTGGQGAGSTNGSSFGSFQSLSFSGSGTTRIGAVSGGGFFNGTINEILIYNTALAAPQRQQIEGYLAAKWGLMTDFAAFNPLVSVPGLKAWFDTFDAAYTTSGNTVTQWRNKTGGANATTGAGAVSINQAYLNGKTSVRFPAGLNNLSIGSLSFSTGHRNVFIVVTQPATSGIYGYVNCAVGGDNVAVQVLPYQTTIEIDRPGLTGLVTTPTGLFGATSFLSMCTSNGNQGIWVNGSNQTLSTNGIGASSTFFSTGSTVNQILGTYSASTPAAVDMYEVLYYDGGLTTFQRQQIEGYLAWKWGLQANLPTTHPFVLATPPLPAHPYKTLPPTTSQPAQYSEVSPGNWTHDWQPYLRALTRANSGATPSVGTAITTSSRTGIATTLAPNGNLYIYPWSGTAQITVLTLSTGALNYITSADIVGEKYYSSCLGPDGNIYYAPYNTGPIGVLYPSSSGGTFSVSAIQGTNSQTNGAYCAIVLAPNGKMYCIPRAYGAATSVGIIDPVAQTFTTMPNSSVATGNGYIGGVLAPNGKIYCIPFGDTVATSVGIIDPLANTFTLMPNSSVSTIGANTGGVLAPNGKIYCSAMNATYIGVIDPIANTFSSTSITGAPGNIAYGVACMGANGKIYLPPRNGSSFGVIDPVAGTLTTGVLSGSGWYTSILGSNGNIYLSSVANSSIGILSFSSVSQLPSLTLCLSAYYNKC